MEREVGGGIGMGNTCKPMADSFQCMTKPTTIKKKKRKENLIFVWLEGRQQYARNETVEELGAVFPTVMASAMQNGISASHQTAHIRRMQVPVYEYEGTEKTEGCLSRPLCSSAARQPELPCVSF